MNAGPAFRRTKEYDMGTMQAQTGTADFLGPDQFRQHLGLRVFVTRINAANNSEAGAAFCINSWARVGASQNSTDLETLSWNNCS